MTEKKQIPARLQLHDSPGNHDPYYGQHFEVRHPINVHWHYCYEIDFILDGHGTQIVNGVNQAYRRGTLTALTDSDFHGYNVDGSHCEMQVYSLHFTDDFLDDVTATRFRAFAGRQLNCRDEEEYDSFRREFVLLFSEMEKDTPERDEFVRNALTRIVLMLSRLYRDTSDADHLVGEIPKELRYLDSHFREPITEDDAARNAGFSTAYFSKLFRKRYGVTFQHYLLNKRLQWAYGLIRSSELPITAICYEAGFNSHNYFSRRFKMRYGVTPMEVRRRNREARTNSTHK